MIKPQTPKGFRDFLPGEARARQFVAQKVKEVFEQFGFEPLETPTLEYASVLLGKYGKEADKLVFRFTDRRERELALRFDQTVPTARVLSQYQNELPKFFRRYQIQNVYRAEKPQKGRYREFTQCDIDIFGSSSPLADSEIIACTYYAFKNVGYPKIQIKINDRKILFDTLSAFATPDVPLMSIIQTIDKLDRIDRTGVLKELQKKGLPLERATKALDTIQKVKPTDNLETIMSYSFSLGVPKNVLLFDPTIARGLDYYTGMIFEVFIPDLPGKSFAGGGRYDNLIKLLGGTDTPAVGIAFGFDRMVEAAEELGLIQTDSTATSVLVTVFNEQTLNTSFSLSKTLRERGINAELFPAIVKLEKQLKYADKKGIPFVVIQGPEEMKNKTVQIKIMGSRESFTIPQETVVDFVNKQIDKSANKQMND